MTEEQINIRLHEIIGLCWHETHYTYTVHRDYAPCIKCNKPCMIAARLNYDLVNTWQGFGIMWEFMQKHERWEEFLEWHGVAECINPHFISPRPFAETMCEFFKEDKP